MSPIAWIVIAGVLGFVVLILVASVVWFLNRSPSPPASSPLATRVETPAEEPVLKGTLNVNRVVHVVDADEDLQGLLLYVAGRMVAGGDHERAAAVFSVANQQPTSEEPAKP